MSQFLDLPVEILPLILGYLPKSQHLAHASLVSRTFSTFAVPQLYSRIAIYSWHKEGKTKVLQLFGTLASCPPLAHHVHRLEIRDFPKAVVSSEGDTLNFVVQGLRNCRNLHSCTWTRDGTLNSEILIALCLAPKLREIEFNGHSQGQYDPQILSRFRGLTKLSLIMPSSVVISQLDAMLRCSGGLLRHLTVICKTTGVVNDRVLETSGPLLTNLEQLYLTGCPKVTERGVISVTDFTQVGLTGLGLEGVSPKFDMTAFAIHCNHRRSLARLRSITLTVTRSMLDPKAWTSAVVSLLSQSPLERFHIYATSTPSDTGNFDDSVALLPLLPQFLQDLVLTHGQRLTRFSIHRMPLGLQTIEAICRGCNNLQELFIVVEPRLLNALPDLLVHATKLRAIHINYPTASQLEDESDNDGELGDPDHVLTASQTLNFVRRCGPSLFQFGCNTKVWQVGREIEESLSGDKVARLCLLPYESPVIPEQFLVVRT
ncbi:hypothetical protein FA15DRAFT_585861 [Coprinopsis marcescibilis]|uniref:F-box domain-containing protein n=1 Tax=Coprinopsis marcescibilis TaxID=230819 RepID=A0A5C3L4T8_COPMA|nr:hypothetical protein FA15DRAFT_585861 [Coprinopsis marcescibilis]